MDRRAPETFNLVEDTLDLTSRRNLGQISAVIQQIASGVEFNEESASYVAINGYVSTAIQPLSAWFFECTYRTVARIMRLLMMELQWPMFPILKCSTTRTSSWMRRFNPSPSISHRTRFTRYTSYSLTIARIWYVHSHSAGCPAHPLA